MKHRKTECKIICLEGINGSGKTTQAKLLVDRLKEQGQVVTYVKFPDYTSVTGKKILTYLNGDMGKRNEVDPYLVCSLYALDRIASIARVNALRETNDYLVYDRATYSNLALQGAGMDAVALSELRFFIEQTEFGTGIIQPDLTVHLDTEPSLVVDSMLARPDEELTCNGKLDIHEDDVELELASLEIYRGLCVKDTWSSVLCTGLSGRRDINDIANMVYGVLVRRNLVPVFKVTRVLMHRTNVTGAKLEELLTDLVYDLNVKTIEVLAGDNKWHYIADNNDKITRLLEEAVTIQNETMAELKRAGSNDNPSESIIK